MIGWGLIAHCSRECSAAKSGQKWNILNQIKTLKHEQLIIYTLISTETI
jgi:hypothetical protein